MINIFSSLEICTLPCFKYDTRYLEYYIDSLILKNKNKISIDKIIEYILKEYESCINVDNLKKHLKTNYIFKDDFISLKTKRLIIISRVNNIINQYYKCKNIDDNKLVNIINGLKNSVDFDYLLAIFLSYDKNKFSEFDEYYFMIAYDLLSNYSSYYLYFDKLLNKISYDNMENIKIGNEFLDFNEIYLLNLSDLRGYTIEFTLSMLSINIRQVISKTIGEVIPNYISDFCSYVKDIFNITTKNSTTKDILYKRCGVLCDEMTLQEVAEIFNLTKERIRQITKKLKEKIKIKTDLLDDKMIHLFNTIVDDKKYIELDELLSYINDKELSEQLLMLWREPYSIISYDKKYNIIYNKAETTIDDLVNYMTTKLGKALSVSYFNSLTGFKKEIVENNYRLKEKIYILNGVNYGDIIKDLCDYLFPNGLSPYEPSTVDFVNSTLKSKFDLRENIVTERTLIAILTRNNYILYDKGMLINKDNILEIPDDIFDIIMKYISKSDGIVYYGSLYEEFKNQLNEINIFNKYQLKGLLDYRLPSEYKHNRDYISFGGVTNIKSYLLDYVLQQKTIINVEEMKKQYVGFEDYVFYNNLSSIEDLIWIRNIKECILYRNISISDNTIKLLNDTIELLFKTYGVDYLPVSKLLGRLKMFNEEIFNELKYFNTDYALFSLLAYIFKDKYKFRRPYISKDFNTDITHNVIIHNYVTKLDKFCIKDIHKFTNKLHLRTIGNYLELQKELSDDYLQINIDTLLKKHLFKVSEDFFDDFIYEINYYLNSFGSIDTRKYNDYSNLPSIRMGWNKYLLIGIIRTFYSSYYNIEYTENSYDMTDFIIRRV